MREHFLDVAALTFELGAPALLLVAARVVPRRRAMLLGGFIATIPMLLIYAFISIAYLIPSNNADWAFRAMWLMSFAVYVAMLVVGLLIGAALNIPPSKESG